MLSSGDAPRRRLEARDEGVASPSLIVSGRRILHPTFVISISRI